MKQLGGGDLHLGLKKVSESETASKEEFGVRREGGFHHGRRMVNSKTGEGRGGANGEGQGVKYPGFIVDP